MGGTRRVSARRLARLMAAASLTLILLSGCYLYPVEEEEVAPPLVKPEGVSYSTYEVKLGTIEQIAQVSGTFRAEEYYECMFEHRGGYIRSINVRLGNTVKKGDVLMELDTDTLESDVRRKEIAVEKCKVALKDAQKQRDQDTIRFAEWDLELAEMELKDARDSLTKSVLVAPSDGRVAYMAKLGVGDYAQALTTLVRIENTDSLILELDGTKADQMKFGMKVTVTSAAKEYEGEVVMTPSTAPQTLPDDQRNTVRVRVEGLDPKIKVGDSARASVVLDCHEDAIVVPKNLVRNFMGRRYVQVLENDLPVERDVEIGLETTAMTEILSGLEVGELVIDR